MGDPLPRKKRVEERVWTPGRATTPATCRVCSEPIKVGDLCYRVKPRRGHVSDLARLCKWCGKAEAERRAAEAGGGTGTD